jgi:hypothetical protein
MPHAAGNSFKPCFQAASRSFAPTPATKTKNEPLQAHPLAGRFVCPDLGTKYHANDSVALFLDGRKVLTILLVTLIPATNLDLEEVH